MKRIDCSFLEFLQENKLQTLIPFFVYSQSCQGYGILDKIPAFYGLFWNTPELMRTVSELLRLAQDKPNVIVLTKGYQSLWDQMIKKEKLNIIYNCNITKLNRYLDDKDKKIEISYNLNVPKEEQKIQVVDIDLNEFDKDDDDTNNQQQVDDNKDKDDDNKDDQNKEEETQTEKNENNDDKEVNNQEVDDNTDKDQDNKDEQNKEETQTENNDDTGDNDKQENAEVDDKDKEEQNDETQTENDEKDKKNQNKTDENVQNPATLSDDEENKAEDKKVTEEENKYNEQEDDIKDIMIEADVLFLACGCKKALHSFWSDATEEEKRIFGDLEDHTLCATLFEYDAQPELETHQTVVDVWPNITWKGSGQIYAYRNSAKCLMGHEKYDKLIKSGKIKRDRAVAYQYLNRGPDERELNDNIGKDNKDKISLSFIEKQEIKQETSVLLLNQLKHDLEVWGETNINVIRQECWDYMPMWNKKDIQKQYPWIVKDELQGKYKKTFYIGSSVCFESVLNVVEYNYEICNEYCFDDPGNVFFCKKRIGSDKGPFAQD